MIEDIPLLNGLLSGDRRSLAKGITLIESSLRIDEDEGERLLTALMPYTGKALRIGISGVPGVGKSTFIEAIGTKLVDSGKRIAVLAIDPSSPLSGGSIMGDRTRMPNLSAHADVFIRPSPSAGVAGGVARRTRESILLCEAAGYDIVLVETVGAGQGEYLVASMVDLFVMLHLPNSGDDLQGIKKGILELADIVVVTKSDGDNTTAAKLAAQQLGQSLRLTRNEESEVPILLCSSLQNKGIEEVLQTIEAIRTQREESGQLQARRKNQSESWFRREVDYQLLQAAFKNARFDASYQHQRAAVANANIPASIAARKLVAELNL